MADYADYSKIKYEYYLSDYNLKLIYKLILASSCSIKKSTDKPFGWLESNKGYAGLEYDAYLDTYEHMWFLDTYDHMWHLDDMYNHAGERTWPKKKNHVTSLPAVSAGLTANGWKRIKAFMVIWSIHPAVHTHCRTAVFIFSVPVLTTPVSRSSRKFVWL